MTGYGIAESSEEGLSLSLEIKSYNNRYLDIYVYLPQSLSPLEQFVRQRISTQCRRGKVEVSIRLKDSQGGGSLVIDRELAASAWKELSSLARELGAGESLGFSDLLGIEGIVSTDRERNIDQVRDRLEPLLAKALEDFAASRKREGEATLRDIEGHLLTIERESDAVRKRLPELEQRFKENLRERFMEIVGKVDEERVLSETAVLLVKTSISEELARLAAHLGDFRRELAENPAPGKKLDFLCQELNREINTTGSKTPDMDTARSVIAMKDALENIREQLRNIE